MTTTVISLKGRIHEYGPRLEHAPANLVYVGRTMTGVRAGGWDLHKHPLHNPFTLRQSGTPEAAVTAYVRHLVDRPELLDQARALRGKVLACWCAPQLCHANAIAWYADGLDVDRLAERAADLETAAGLVETTLLARLT